MPLVALGVPPGVFRRGTEYQTKGRAYDASLARWYGAAIGPISGWQQRETTAMTGVPRAALCWRDNAYGRWMGVATHSKLYAVNSAQAKFDISPTDYVAGRADAVAKTGFGYGIHGEGTWGTARPDTGSSLPATVPDVDNWGEYFVSCSDADGRLLQWQLDTGTKAAAVTNAPTGNNGVVVTAERAMMALGASGNPRLCKWSDLEANTTWTPTSTNKAGDFTLQTSGQIMAGRRLPDETLILTDLDAWVANYVGGTFVYGFRKVGSDCGVISRQGVCLAGGLAVWWGQSGFWAYDGALRPINCDVLEYVTANLNNAQRSKVSAWHNVKYGEVWWFYPSAVATECDSYVFWKYPSASDPAGSWNIGSLARTCGAVAGVFQYPICFDSTGLAYDHERGSTYGGSSPYVRLGPFELGQGDTVMRATKIIPDEDTVGESTVYFLTRLQPNGSQTTQATVSFTSTGEADVLFSARQAELVVTFTNDNTARWGTPRLNVQPGGRR